MEPSHTTLSTLIGSKKSFSSSNIDKPAINPSCRWENDNKSLAKVDDSTQIESGRILLTFDPGMIYARKPKEAKMPSSQISSYMKTDSIVEGSNEIDEIITEATNGNAKQTEESISASDTPVAKISSIGTHVFFKGNPHIITRRGSLVSFSKGKNGVATNIRLINKVSTTNAQGILRNINKNDMTAVFEYSDSKAFDVSLTEVVSCDINVLNENEEVEGILYEDKIYGGMYYIFSQLLLLVYYVLKSYSMRQ